MADTGTDIRCQRCGRVPPSDVIMYDYGRLCEKCHEEMEGDMSMTPEIVNMSDEAKT